MSSPIKSKKGVSIVVGYVILIALALTMSGVVYMWIKTYVPADSLNCPSGVSIFIKKSKFNSTDSTLNITIKNNGKFNLGGYFIQVTNDSSQELATIDISTYLNTSYSGQILGNSVLFSVDAGNSLEPTKEASYIFDIPSTIGTPYSLRITPLRFQEEKNRERLVSCQNAQTTQLIEIIN